MTMTAPSPISLAGVGMFGPPAPASVSTDAQYLEHRFLSPAYNHYVSGWTVGEARSAQEAHDLGSFVASAALAYTCTRLAPIDAALKQRSDLPRGMPREIVGASSRGAARLIRDESARVYEDIETRVIGDILYERPMMGVSFLQHVYAPVKQDDGTILQIPTTYRWPTLATWFHATQRRYYALTLDGMVPIVDGDGHWTIIGDGERPHLHGAIRPLALAYMKSGLADRDEANLSETLGRMVPWVELPVGVEPEDEQGQEILAIFKNLGRGRSGAVFRNGVKINTMDLANAASAVVFEQIQKRGQSWCFLAILGTDGTGISGTGGVYQSPVFKGVAFNRVRADCTTLQNGLNHGLFRPFAAINYGEPRLAARLRFQLPDLDEAARLEDLAKRDERLMRTIELWRARGFAFGDEEVEALAVRYGATPPPKLAATTQAPIARIDLAPTDIAEVVTVDEARRSQGLGPIGDDRGGMTIGQLRGAAKAEPPVDPPSEENAAA